LELPYPDVLSSRKFKKKAIDVIIMSHHSMKKDIINVVRGCDGGTERHVNENLLKWMTSRVLMMVDVGPT